MFITSRLKHPFLGKWWGPSHFWNRWVCFGYGPFPAPTLRRLCAVLVWLEGRTKNTNFHYTTCESIDTTAVWKKLRFINGFELTKKRSRRYPAKTITDADNADDIAILANTSKQAKTLLHSLERAAAGIGLHVNAQETEYMCYNQTGDISTLDGTPLKLVDKVTYLGSSVSSTKKDIDTRLMKAWTANNRLKTT